MLLRWEDQDTMVDTRTLDDVLDEIAARVSDPVLVSLSGPAGALSLGLGHPGGGLLLFLPGDGSTGPLHSIGDVQARDGRDGDVRFRRAGQSFCFSPRCLIPHDVMRDAARFFVAAGTLPSQVSWEAEPSAAGPA
ncbi:Imm1 family immunity protein [Mycolicibacterium palauense]|uniref:Imm1 family immunity protein n=1 Tax=Mycolicibacterium palauense TaxID=2034511 RepID=UPI000BFEDAB8|nr:Imm1 family immunity protein [Mycolicibacterium palauense]